MAIGGTGAFFSDAETSTGNVFAAGAIDLKVDNESYYNGNVCAENPLAGVSEPDQPYWTWQGPNAFPVPGTECSTSWELSDLDEGHLFFNFLDLKPDDEGEDTISLHVDTNDAWACMNLALTSDDDNSSTEPELEVDVQDDENDIWDGELAQNIDMVWWADDGDNVLEEGEQIITNSIETLSALAPENNPVQIALADSDENVWGGQGPIPGQTTRYIGKAWCFGTLTLSPVPAGQGDNPSVNPGITCDGTLLGNETQTDGATLDVSFSAVQARHNDSFQCEGDCELDTVNTIIPDSGFENPEVNTAQQWDIFDSPAGAWSVVWRDAGTSNFGNQVRPEPAHLEIHEGVLGTPFEGDQYAELDSDWGGPADNGTDEPASIMIYQDVTTVSGRAYQIKFAFAPRPNTPASDNRLEVRWGGVVVHDTGNVADGNAGIEWQEISVDVVATTTTTQLSFTDLGTSNSLGTFLDDVRLYSEVCRPLDN